MAIKHLLLSSLPTTWLPAVPPLTSLLALDARSFEAGIQLQAAVPRCHEGVADAFQLVVACALFEIFFLRQGQALLGKDLLRYVGGMQAYKLFTLRFEVPM